MKKKIKRFLAVGDGTTFRGYTTKAGNRPDGRYTYTITAYVWYGGVLATHAIGCGLRETKSEAMAAAFASFQKKVDAAIKEAKADAQVEKYGPHAKAKTLVEILGGKR